VKRLVSAAAALLLLLAAAAEAPAWPQETVVHVSRDARRLLPRSLARLLAERESQIQEEMRRFPPALASAMAADLPTGTLRPQTLAGLEREVARVVELARSRQVGEALVRLGALARITADLSDPVLSVGPEGWPPGLTREYYALFSANIGRMPVVVDRESAVQLRRDQLPQLWKSLIDRARPQAETIRAELLRDGRVVRHEQLDYRSPAWAVASLAYSRAVSATAATWLAAWRDANGDTTNTPRAREVAPRPAPDTPPPGGGRTPQAEAP
jgi:hypothetical protein